MGIAPMGTDPDQAAAKDGTIVLGDPDGHGNAIVLGEAGPDRPMVQIPAPNSRVADAATAPGGIVDPGGSSTPPVSLSSSMERRPPTARAVAARTALRTAPRPAPRPATLAAPTLPAAATPSLVAPHPSVAAPTRHQADSDAEIAVEREAELAVEGEVERGVEREVEADGGVGARTGLAIDLDTGDLADLDTRDPGDLTDDDTDDTGEGRGTEPGRGTMVVDAPVRDVPRLNWPWPLRMINPVRSHSWGSRAGLAGVQRRPAGRRPEAELWVGAHPIASSSLVDSEGREVLLLEAVECDPEGLLGRLHRNRFGARLPFLLKVVAVERALAVQAHPARRAAAEGFARQEEAGVPLRGPARIFVDPHPKPELLVALTPFDALVGLRDPRSAAHLLEVLDVAPLVPLRRALSAAAAMAHGPARDGTLDALVRLAGWPFRQRAVLAAGVSDAARAALVNPGTPHHPDTRSALEWVIRLADQHPGDPMVLAPLLLEFVHLAPGESVFVPPGVLHTFLHGVALEAAGSSANVVRAGLTRRPADPEAVRAVVEVAAQPIVGVPEEECDLHETAVLAPAEEFRLSRIALAGNGVVAPVPRQPGPQVVLCLDGEVEVGVGARLTHLCSGESAYLGPEATEVVLSGEGVVYRITTGG